MKFRFLTSTPLDVTRGSGTYVGISVLAGALRDLGHTVAVESSTRRFPVYTLERLWFNRSLYPRDDFDCTVGFDMDGYRIAAQGRHVAALKGVIADEVRFESGMTAFTMGIQARCERLHVRRAARIITSSRYSAEFAQRFYGLSQLPAVVPEPIDLAVWRAQLAAFPASAARFTVLCVSRFYKRKRVNLLLHAAAKLRAVIPNLEVRIVGNGPRARAWHALARELKLADTVTWLPDIARSDLAAEYNRASVFCLPSVQEGFGIVLLEAMTAGLPIVAARAAAVPEVVPHATLVEPESVDSLAAGILDLYSSPETRSAQRIAGRPWVEQFDAPRVAQLFLAAVKE
ncbi:MAG: glycosyltransferase family 4 protein [Candidatus Solibacter sp.]